MVGSFLISGGGDFPTRFLLVFFYVIIFYKIPERGSVYIFMWKYELDQFFFCENTTTYSDQW